MLSLHNRSSAGALLASTLLCWLSSSCKSIERPNSSVAFENFGASARSFVVSLPNPSLDPASRHMLAHLHPGCICLYERNVENPTQIRALIHDINQQYPLGEAPLIGIDQEGGNVSRIHWPAAELPSAMAIGATRSEELAHEAGLNLGKHLRSLGITVNFAPVIESPGNPESDAIGIRAFSDRPEWTARLSAAFIQGQQEAGVISVAKHFPGHGGSGADSHKSLPRVRGDEAQVLAQWKPFRSLLLGVDGVMTAHVALPDLLGTNELASLSKRVTSDLLRDKLGFQGLIVTDALTMLPVLSQAGFGEGAVQALNAGADMVLVSNGPIELVESAIERALKSGELSKATLDRAEARIQAAKARRHSGDAVPLSTPVFEHETANKIAQASITLLKNDHQLLPLTVPRSVLVLTTSRSFDAAVRGKGALRESILLKTVGLSLLGEPKPLASRDLVNAEALAREADVTVVAIINPVELSLFEAARKAAKQTVLVSLGRPILLDQGKAAQSLVAAYSYTDASAQAAAQVIFGELEARGQLPITLPSFPFGSGLLGGIHEVH